MTHTVEISTDKTIKFSYAEGYYAVLIPLKGDKLTLCISTQIGCPIKCKFCQSGTVTFKDNLKLEQLQEQVEVALKYLNFNSSEGYAKNKITAIVLMGMGEPLLNFQNVLEFCKWLNTKYQYPFDKITVSTSGILPQMKKLLELPEKIHLALSLHSPFQEIRDKLIPNAKSNPITELIEFCHEYNPQRKRGIMIEYLMIENLTDRIQDIQELLSFKLKKNTLFNLIPLNIELIIENRTYSKSKLENMLAFKEKLMNAGYRCFIREHKGEDISAACGMLK